MAYALQRAAGELGDLDLIERARLLSQSAASGGLLAWVTDGMSLKSEAESIAAAIAARTGSNPLDVDDPYGAVGTSRTEQISPLSDAGEVIGDAGSAVASGFAALTDAGKWLVVGLVAVAVVLVAREVRS